MKFLYKAFIYSFLFLPVFSPAQNVNGLVARYYFNEANTKNDIGSSFAKAVGISFCDDRFGNPHSACCLFGNKNSYLNLGTSLLLKSVEGSVSFWINMSVVNYSGTGYACNPMILSKNNRKNDFFEGYSVSYGWVSKKLEVCASMSDSNQIVVFSNHLFELEQWHHVVMTYNDKLLCLYIDGKLENCSDKNFRSQFSPTDSVMIGNSANIKNNRFFSGYIDDIRIYNRVLSAREVSELYKEPDPNQSHVIMKFIFIILFSVAGISLIALWIIRKFKRELVREKEKNKLQRQMYEMEMKVIKAQMNPHFIFNSMNSIQQFILANDNENANTYLVKFARLLRKILESSTDEYISVENEIDILHKYIEIESLRFEYAFAYEINTDEKLKGSNIRIPQMLIQPFVENAIWHGLLMKGGNKNLRITFEYVSKILLLCTVDDNGVGRNAITSEKIISKGKSLGISFTYQRLELMSKEWGGNYGIEIRDKTNEKGNSTGTQVIIRIPIIKN